MGWWQGKERGRLWEGILGSVCCFESGRVEVPCPLSPTPSPFRDFFLLFFLSSSSLLFLFTLWKPPSLPLFFSSTLTASHSHPSSFLPPPPLSREKPLSSFSQKLGEMEREKEEGKKSSFPLWPLKSLARFFSKRH